MQISSNAATKPLAIGPQKQTEQRNEIFIGTSLNSLNPLYSLNPLLLFSPLESLNLLYTVHPFTPYTPKALTPPYSLHPFTHHTPLTPYTP